MYLNRKVEILTNNKKTVGTARSVFKAGILFQLNGNE